MKYVHWQNLSMSISFITMFVGTVLIMIPMKAWVVVPGRLKKNSRRHNRMKRNCPLLCVGTEGCHQSSYLTVTTTSEGHCGLLFCRQGDSEQISPCFSPHPKFNFKRLFLNVLCCFHNLSFSFPDFTQSCFSAGCKYHLVKKILTWRCFIWRLLPLQLPTIFHLSLRLLIDVMQSRVSLELNYPM